MFYRFNNCSKKMDYLQSSRLLIGHQLSELAHSSDLKIELSEAAEGQWHIAAASCARPDAVRRGMMAYMAGALIGAFVMMGVLIAITLTLLKKRMADNTLRIILACVLAAMVPTILIGVFGAMESFYLAYYYLATVLWFGLHLIGSRRRNA
jgi:hypothetical protein